MRRVKQLTIISADDHLQEPPDLWRKRVPAALRDQAPKMVKQPDGTDAWVWADNPPIAFGRDVAAGRRYEDTRPP